MTKYSSFWKERESSKKGPSIHPVWMGIGFLFLIIIPFISWAMSIYLLEQNFKYGWVLITSSIYASGPDSLIKVKIFLTVAISLILLALIYLIYFFLYRIFGPSRYGPTDAPVKAYKVKKYKR